MSVANYVPPMCDPIDGHLLLDGAYINNLPADIMRFQGAKHVLAFDVGSIDKVNFTNYGDSLNGWKVLLSKWNPFGKPMDVPSLGEILSRLAFISCNKRLKKVKVAKYCLYIRPPIDKYSTMDMNMRIFDEIKDVGYQYGKDYFEVKC